MKRLLLFTAMLVMSGCQTPFLTFAGKALEGEERRVADFGFARSFDLMQLETRPEEPYSVFLRVTEISGRLYLDAAPARRWHQHLQSEPRVRIKLGQFVYPCLAVKITDPDIVQRFLPGRTVYRLDPRGE